MKIKGYTPILDTLVERYNLTCAAIYGKIWRYEQMKDGVCKASQERIANELGLTRKTVVKYCGILEDDGYLKRIGGKIGTVIEWATTQKAGIEIASVAFDDLSPKVTGGVTESYRGVSPKVTQRKDIKKQTKKVKDGATAPPPKKRKRKPPDPLLKHPAVIVWHEVNKRHLNEKLRPRLAEAVPPTPENVAAWRAHMLDWIGRGFNPFNFNGMIETFQNGYKQSDSKLKETKFDRTKAAFQKIAREKELELHDNTP